MNALLGDIQMNNNSEILKKLKELAPWHMDIQINETLSTKDGNQDFYDDPNHRNTSVIGVQDMLRLFNKLYPRGLNGKSFLDVACNAGGYCFLANQMGASFVHGFDVRSHWIKQALFLQEHIPNSDNIIFEVKDFDNFHFSKMYDITLFKGILYHLLDPIWAIKKICEITREVIILDSAYDIRSPKDCLRIQFESQSHIMSGVDKLSWFPGGPDVVIKLLNYFGFKCTRVVFNKPYTGDNTANLGRMRILASRSSDTFTDYDKGNLTY